jgi:serine/threonine-protein kinase
MVTGGVPFDGSTPSAVMHKHLKEPLVPPDHINDTLSSGIGEIIEVMMAKSPEDRYPSIVEVLQDLQTVSRGEPPYQARTKYDHALLEALATTGEVIAPDSEGDTTITEPEGVAAQWVVVLGILLAASLLANVFLLVAR